MAIVSHHSVLPISLSPTLDSLFIFCHLISLSPFSPLPCLSFRLFFRPLLYHSCSLVYQCALHLSAFISIFSPFIVQFVTYLLLTAREGRGTNRFIQQEENIPSNAGSCSATRLMHYCKRAVWLTQHKVEKSLTGRCWEVTGTVFVI